MEDNKGIMKEIMLSEEFQLENLDKYKLHRAVREPKGLEPLDVYVRNFEEWTNWNQPREGQKQDFNREYIFSMMRFYPDGSDVWLFGGVFKKKSGDQDGYELWRDHPIFGEKWIGRLKIRFGKNVGQGRAFRLEINYDQLVLLEILKEKYDGKEFPGCEKVDIDFQQLEMHVNRGDRKWSEPLSNVWGIYVIFDKSNGKKYVGAAYGDGGLWGRWQAYVRTGHAGNMHLKPLLAEDADYARKHFKFTLLERFIPKKTADDVIEREEYWKKVLLSNAKEFGYNDR